MRVYPDVFTRTIYDRGDNSPDFSIGWGTATPAFKAGVRYTATSDTKLAGVDFIYNTETVPTGTITVEVRAAGTTTLAPGAVIYTTTYSAAAYFPVGGDYITFAFGDDAPTIASGSDYWITIKLPEGILYPGAAQLTGITLGHSFIENSDGTWSALTITDGECAWMMRAINVIPVPTTKTLNLSSIFLEGFYTGYSTMMQAQQHFMPGDTWGPYYSDGSVDHITVELYLPGTHVEPDPDNPPDGTRIASNFDTPIFSNTDVPLSTTGTATVTVPGADNGSYYLTIKQRNHLATVSALLLDFSGATITYAFDAFSQAFEGNMTQALEPDGETMSPPLIFGGDTNQDGQIESDDINAVGNDAAVSLLGYGPTDIVPDAQVESADINIVGNNAALNIYAHIPM